MLFIAQRAQRQQRLTHALAANGQQRCTAELLHRFGLVFHYYYC
jgi:hypothetical protein